MAVSNVLDRLRQPEYTGENRCVPCTAVNVVIAVALALAVQAAVILVDGPPVGAALASATVFGLAMAAIYLRGYLVPGTPWLTKTYFPEWVLRRFDKAGARESAVQSPPDGDATDPGDVDVEAVLSRMDVVTECEDVDDLCLTDDVRTAWRERIERLRGDEDAGALATELASLLDVDPEDITIEAYGDAWTAHVGGQRVGQWESRAAVLADVGAAATLREHRAEDWSALSVTQRGQLLQGLRVFLERCPACDGPVGLDQETVESCCRSIEVLAVTCQDCGARLFEAEQRGG